MIALSALDNSPVRSSNQHFDFVLGDPYPGEQWIFVERALSGRSGAASSRCCLPCSSATRSGNERSVRSFARTRAQFGRGLHAASSSSRRWVWSLQLRQLLRRH